jgi:hypothetical protein
MLAACLGASDIMQAQRGCRYLGAKLQYGRIPLYESGHDAEAKQFRSLHAVQRHMVDTGRCRMAYSGDVEEYEDFYTYPCAPALLAVAHV